MQKALRFDTGSHWLECFRKVTNIMGFTVAVRQAFRGSIVAAAAATSAALWNSTGVAHAEENALNPGQWKEFVVSSVDRVSHDTAKLRLFPKNRDERVGYTVASCITARVKTDTGVQVVRPYTPVNKHGDTTGIDLVVKGYPQGLASKAIVNSKPGDVIELKGPYLKFEYAPNKYDEIVCLAGGSGITPILQLINSIVENRDDQTKITLVFANKTEEDILLREQFEALALINPNFRSVFVVSEPSGSWTGAKGHVTEEFLKQQLPAPDSNTMVFVCGPPGFMTTVCGPKDKQKQGDLTGILKNIGFTSNNVFKF